LLSQVYAPGNVQIDPSDEQNRGLVLRLSAYDSYEENNYQSFLQSTSPTSPSTTTTTQPVYMRSGNRGAARGDLSYQYDMTGTRGSLATDVQGSASAYSGSGRVIYRAHGSLAAATTLGRRNAVHAHYSATYAPYYSFGVFQNLGLGVSGAITDPDLNYAVAPAQTLRHAAGVGFNRGLTRRMTFNMNYDVQYRDRSQGSVLQHGAGAMMHYQIARDLGFHFGYLYRRGTYSTMAVGAPRDFHDVDVGLDYTKSVTLGNRRVTFSGSTGSTINRRQRGVALSTQRQFDIRLMGQANLSYRISTAWSAHIRYQRGWQFIDAFDTPTFVDGVTVGIGGPIGSRLTSGTSVSYQHGTLGYSSTAQHDGYAARTGLNLRLAGQLSAFANLNYYNQKLPTGVVLPAGFPSALERTGFRGGVSYRMTLFGDTRRGRP
jgi:hypothetical protein